MKQVETTPQLGLDGLYIQVEDCQAELKGKIRQLVEDVKESGLIEKLNLDMNSISKNPFALMDKLSLIPQAGKFLPQVNEIAVDTYVLIQAQNQIIGELVKKELMRND